MACLGVACLGVACLDVACLGVDCLLGGVCLKGVACLSLTCMGRCLLFVLGLEETFRPIDAKLLPRTARIGLRDDQTYGGSVEVLGTLLPEIEAALSEFITVLEMRARGTASSSSTSARSRGGTARVS